MSMNAESDVGGIDRLLLPGLLGVFAFAALAVDSVSAIAKIDEITVTARKRAETLQDAPVAVYAMGKEVLDNYGVADLEQVGTLTPGLILMRSTNNAAVNIYLRGVGTSFVSVGFDQAVAINVDNVPVSKGRIIYQSLVDMEQIEVLKGPQALFFGKNSTAGVISVKTANPGDNLELIGRVGYEFNGRRFFGEAVASGPLGDKWGARLAFRGSSLNGGFFKNNSFELTGIPRRVNVPQEDEYGGRITLAYDGADAFELNAKISVDRFENDGANGFSQLINCQGPGGAAQPIFGVPSMADCELNKLQSTPAMDPTVAANFPWGRDGEPYRTYIGIFGAVTATYRWDDFVLTSVTGYYDFKTRLMDEYDLGSAAQTYGNERVDYRSLTQEVRLSSLFDGSFNFTLGLFFDDTSLAYGRGVRIFAHGPDSITGRTDTWDSGGRTRGNTYSAFLELAWAITPEIELSGGTRYSHEKKNSLLELFFSNTDLVNAGFFTYITEPVYDKFSDGNVSPSVTLSWQPTDNITLFASYKKGYKSGGTNIGQIPFAGVQRSTIDFDSETVGGAEVGVKARFLQRNAWVGLTFYRYTFSDLQVSIFDPNTISLNTTNAGRYRTTGFELDLDLAVPSIEGLRFRGSLYYNRARYVEHIAACYTGQTIAEGCDQLFNPAAGAFTGQELTGRPGNHAPKWTLIGGVSYDFTIANGGVLIGLAAQARYTSSYYLQETLPPTQRQDGYVNFDASLRVSSSDETWEVAVIGRNLADELAGANAIDTVGTGSGTGTTVGVLADTYLTHSKPREIVLQVTVRY